MYKHLEITDPILIRNIVKKYFYILRRSYLINGKLCDLSEKKHDTTICLPTALGYRYLRISIINHNATEAYLKEYYDMRQYTLFYYNAYKPYDTDDYFELHFSKACNENFYTLNVNSSSNFDINSIQLALKEAMNLMDDFIKYHPCELILYKLGLVNGV